MNRHALLYSEVEKYAQLFRQYLQSQRLDAKVEIDTFKTNIEASIIYPTDPEDWRYDDSAGEIGGK